MAPVDSGDYVLSGIYYSVLVRNTCQYSQQTRRWPNAGPMLTHRLRRWPSIKPTTTSFLCPWRPHHVLIGFYCVPMALCKSLLRHVAFLLTWWKRGGNVAWCNVCILKDFCTLKICSKIVHWSMRNKIQQDKMLYFNLPWVFGCHPGTAPGSFVAAR